MPNPPAFQMYAADFLVDTQDWTVDEVGIYLRLLLHEWVNGKLPNNQKRLSRIAGCSAKKFQKRWDTIKIKFQVNGDGFLYNNRLEQEREKQLLWREKSKLGGIESGKSRRRVVKRVVEPNHEPNANSSSSSSYSIDKSIYKPPYSPPFEKFWDVYPRKVGKGAAFEKWKKWKCDRIIDQVINALVKQKRSDQWRKDNGQFIPNPATWVNQRRWEDEIEETNEPQKIPDITGKRLSYEESYEE